MKGDIFNIGVSPTGYDSLYGVYVQDVVDHRRFFAPLEPLNIKGLKIKSQNIPSFDYDRCRSVSGRYDAY